MAAAVSHPMPIIERLSEYKWLPLVPMFFVLSGVYVGVYACLYPYGVLGMFGLSVDVPWSSNELKITECESAPAETSHAGSGRLAPLRRHPR